MEPKYKRVLLKLSGGALSKDERHGYTKEALEHIADEIISAVNAGIEVAVVDQNKKCVTNYGRKRVEYNFSTREIQNYGLFKSALSELLEEMKIAPNSQAYFVLPNVFFCL